MKVEHVERDDLRRLRDQRAGGAGESRGDRIDGDEAARRRNAERAGAQPVFAQSPQRKAERRLHDPPRQRERREQHRQTVERGVALAGEADRKQMEYRREFEVQSVGAAGRPGIAIGEFAEHQADAERHHQARQIGAAQHERRGREAEEASHEAGENEPDERIADATARQNRRAIGADSEKRGMAERENAGIAEDQIERHREQAGDQDFIDQQRARGQREDQQDEQDPEGDLSIAPARAARQMRLDAR